MDEILNDIFARYFLKIRTTVNKWISYLTCFSLFPFTVVVMNKHLKNINIYWYLYHHKIIYQPTVNRHTKMIF